MGSGRGVSGTVLRWAAAAAVVMALLLYVPTPYVVYEPGLTLPVSQLVRIGAADADGGGTAASGGQPDGWTMTTVYMAGRTNYWTVLQAAWRNDRETHDRKKVLGSSTAADYAARMSVMMAGSQSSAVEAAYRAAGIAYESVPIALDVTSGAGVLRTGDRILSVDGQPAGSAAALLEALRAAGAGTAELGVLRGGERTTVRIELGAAAATAGEEGLPELLGGVQLAEQREIRPADPALTVAVQPGSVGGPSAGLAFALYIYDALTPGDLTGGRQIAATGAIEPAGSISAVGGVGMKVIAAARSGAELFLVPAGNEPEARAKAESMSGRIAVKGVASLGEAIALLQERG